MDAVLFMVFGLLLVLWKKSVGARSTKTCPYCAMTIPYNARICPCCGAGVEGVMSLDYVRNAYGGKSGNGNGKGLLIPALLVIGIFLACAAHV